MNIVDRCLQSWLAPPAQNCLVCGSRVSASGQFGICSKCERRIPWIEHIRCTCCGRQVGCPDCLRPDRVRRSFECNRSAVQYTADMKEWISDFKYRGNEKLSPLFGKMLQIAYQALQEERTTVERLSLDFAIRANGQDPVKSAMNHSHAMIHPDRRSVRRSRIWEMKRWQWKWWQAASPVWEPELVTYVPVSESRLMERGFNQAERMAHELCRRQKLHICELLIRSRDTGKQSFKGRKERGDSIAHAFAPAGGARESLLQTYEGRHHVRFGQTPLCVLIVDDIYTTGSTLEQCSSVLKALGQEVNIPLTVYGLTWARS